jgi:hypothetical protein
MRYSGNMRNFRGASAGRGSLGVTGQTTDRRVDDDETHLIICLGNACTGSTSLISQVMVKQRNETLRATRSLESSCVSYAQTEALRTSMSF